MSLEERREKDAEEFERLFQEQGPSAALGFASENQAQKENTELSVEVNEPENQAREENTELSVEVNELQHELVHDNVNSLEERLEAEVIQHEREDMAARRIQAGFRGMQVRKQLNRGGLDTREGSVHNKVIPTGEEFELEINPINDGKPIHSSSIEESAKPDGNLEKSLSLEDRLEQEIKTHEKQVLAATHIQAGFRGMKARQHVKKMKNRRDPPTPSQGEVLILEPPQTHLEPLILQKDKPPLPPKPKIYQDQLETIQNQQNSPKPAIQSPKKPIPASISVPNVSRTQNATSNSSKPKPPPKPVNLSNRHLKTMEPKRSSTTFTPKSVLHLNVALF